MRKNYPYTSVLWVAAFCAWQASPAWAGRASRDDLSGVNLRQEMRKSPVAPARSSIFKGNLSCDLGTANTGGSCDVQLTESGSGKVYFLSNSVEAKKLYFSGARKVSIQGSLNNETSIAISSISADE